MLFLDLEQFFEDTAVSGAFDTLMGCHKAAFASVREEIKAYCEASTIFPTALYSIKIE